MENKLFLFEQTKIHWLRREQVQTPEVWSGSVDLKKLAFYSKFTEEELRGNRGELVLRISSNALEDEDEVRWEISERGMARIRQIWTQSRRASTEAETSSRQGTKWGSFDKILNRILEGRMMLDVSETLQDHDSVVKGSSKVASSILDGLNNGVTDCFFDLLTKICSTHDGTEYVRQLLRSEDEDRVLIGLALLSGGPFIGVLEQEVQEISDSLRFSRRVRDLARAALPVETLRAHDRQALRPLADSVPATANEDDSWSWTP